MLLSGVCVTVCLCVTVSVCVSPCVSTRPQKNNAVNWLLKSHLFLFGDRGLVLSGQNVQTYVIRSMETHVSISYILVEFVITLMWFQIENSRSDSFCDTNLNESYVNFKIFFPIRAEYHGCVAPRPCASSISCQTNNSAEISASDVEYNQRVTRMRGGAGSKFYGFVTSFFFCIVASVCVSN